MTFKYKNMEGKTIEGFVGRHLKKPKGENKESAQYPGASEVGVEQGRERARNELLSFAEQSESGSVIFLGGASSEVRTKSGLELYGDELKEVLKGREDEFVVITRAEIAEAGKTEDDKTRYTKAIEEVQKIVEANPGKKVIIDFPLMLKEISMRSRGGKNSWYDKDGNIAPYANKLLARNDNNDVETIRDWIRIEGAPIDGELGPNPQKTAEDYKHAILRLHDFVKSRIPDRPVAIGMVGHGWDADAFVVNQIKGKVNVENFNEVMVGKPLQESEVMQFKFQGDKTFLSFRGNDYEVDVEQK